MSNHIQNSTTFPNSGSVQTNQEVDNPISSLPEELMLRVFSYLSAEELGKCSIVCKKWQRIADTEALWKALFSKSIFGKAEWETYFGDVGEAPPIPRELYAYLNRPCPIWGQEGKKAHESLLLVLVPQMVKGQPLNLKRLGELMGQPLKGYPMRYVPNEFHLGTYTDPPAQDSHWTLITRTVIPFSRGQAYDVQKDLVQGYPGYEIPHILDAAVAIVVEYVRTGNRLYGYEPITDLSDNVLYRSKYLFYSLTYTRCQEKGLEPCHLAVGGFDDRGLRAHLIPFHFGAYGLEYGVGMMRIVSSSIQEMVPNRKRKSDALIPKGSSSVKGDN